MRIIIIITIHNMTHQRDRETMSGALMVSHHPPPPSALIADSLQFSRLPMSGLDSTWACEFAKKFAQ